MRTSRGDLHFRILEMLQPRQLAHIGSKLHRLSYSRAFTSPRASLHYFRNYSSLSDGQLVSGATNKPLPPQKPLGEWDRAYPVKQAFGTTERAWLYNDTTAKKVVDTYGLDDGGEPKTVIEIYPGPGVISRALLTLPRHVLKKLIILEFSPGFHPELLALAEADDRVVLMKESAYYWEVYQDLQRQGHLDDLARVGFDQVHPSLRMVGHLPMHILAEQWLSQILRHVADRAWMWQYGRFPIHLLMAERTWARVYSQGKLHKSERCKLSVIAQAGCTVKPTLPSAELNPYDHHFFPHSRAVAEKKRTRLAGNPYVSVGLTPRAEPLITLDNIEHWDFVLRQLFATKGQPLNKAIGHVAPGAAIILKSVSFDVTTRISDLTVANWDEVIRAFGAWPFKPDALSQPSKKDWEARAEMKETRI
ncbi:Mitochondrial transcription factor 1 [Tulasnella sp. JGI-2019a]|nr:Mitochondrial transcription factor 1 [Tulasnella sp. JGI-2019a]